MFNIYCDESCHLQYDDSNIMLMGGVACKGGFVKKLYKKIREVKKQYGLSESFEIKWTKVSPAKVDFYIALIDCFFNTPLQFRCVVATGKKNLNHEAYNQTYDEWYYKMYYTLLSKMIESAEEYSVYVDIKDTHGGKKVRKLQEILNHSQLAPYSSCIRKIQIVKSNEVELLQLCDFLLGCVGYFNRFLSPLSNFNDGKSQAKIEICQYLVSKVQRPLSKTTPLSETKFNIFVWEPRE